MVKSWVGHYEKEPEAAKLELVMLILEVIMLFNGCRISVISIIAFK